MEEPPAGSVFVLTTVEAQPAAADDAVPGCAPETGPADRRGGERLPEAHLRPAPSARELDQRVAAAEGSIGRALSAVGTRPGRHSRRREQLLEAVLAGPGPAFERALKQAPWSARGEFTAMLDALAETLGEAARGTLGQPVRRPVPRGAAALSRPRPLLKAMEHVADAREAAWGNVNPQILLAVLGEELAEVL